MTLSCTSTTKEYRVKYRVTALSEDWSLDFDRFMAHYSPEGTYRATNADVQSRLHWLGLGPTNLANEHTLRVLAIMTNTALEMALEISLRHADEIRRLLERGTVDAYQEIFRVISAAGFNEEHLNTFWARQHVGVLIRATRPQAMAHGAVEAIETARAVAMWNFVRCEHRRLCGPVRSNQLIDDMLAALPRP